MKIEDATFLIGDDSILARKQLKDIIKSMGGVQFIEASNGDEVVTLYHQHHPDLVFLDIVMPVKDGNLALEEIMNDNPHAKVIIVSSIGTQSQLKKAIELGACDFVQKPLNRTQIEAILKKRFEGSL